MVTPAGHLPSLRWRRRGVGVDEHRVAGLLEHDVVCVRCDVGARVCAIEHVQHRLGPGQPAVRRDRQADPAARPADRALDAVVVHAVLGARDPEDVSPCRDAVTSGPRHDNCRSKENVRRSASTRARAQRSGRTNVYLLTHIARGPDGGGVIVVSTHDSQGSEGAITTGPLLGGLTRVWSRSSKVAKSEWSVKSSST